MIINKPQKKHKKKLKQQHKGIFQNYNVSSFMSLIYTGQRISISHNEKFFICFSNKPSKYEINFIEYSQPSIVLHTITADDEILSIAITPNDKTLIYSLANCEIIVFSIVNNKVIRKMVFTYPVVSMDIYQKGKFVALGYGNGNIRIYDLEENILTHKYSLNVGRIGIVKWHPSELVVYSSGMNGLIEYDLVKKKSKKYNDHKGGVVIGIGFGKNGKWFVTSACDKIFCVYDYKRKKLLKKIVVYENIVDVNVISKDYIIDKNNGNYGNVSNEVIVAGSGKGNIRVWDVDNGKQLMKDIKVDQFNPSFQYSYILKNEKQIMFTTEDCNFIIYDIKSLRRKRQILGFHDEVLGIKFLSKNTNEFAVVTNSEKIVVFDYETKDSKFLTGHSGLVLCIDVCRNYNFLISGSHDKSLRVWELEKRRCIAISDSHTESVNSVCFSPKSSNYFVSVSEDKTMKKYLTIEVINHYKKLRNNENFTEKDILPLSPQTAVAHKKTITDVTISPDEKLIATSSTDKTVKIWNNDLKLLNTLQHKKGVWCVKFSPVEKVVATGGMDKMIRIWSLSSGLCLKVLEGHNSSILRIEFINIGMQIISSSSSGIVKLWSIKTNDCVNTFDHHNKSVWAICIKNDGRLLITGGEDSMINVWRENTKEIRENEMKIVEENEEKKQELENMINDEDYKKALNLAISLDQPRNTYRIFGILIQKNINFDDVISKLSFNDINYLFQYCVDWNTNSRFFSIAHHVLSSMFRVFRPNFVSWEYETSLDSLLLYSGKHLKRINKLLESSCVLDYTISQMNVVDGAEEDDDDEKMKEKGQKELAILPKIQLNNTPMLDDKNGDVNIVSTLKKRKREIEKKESNKKIKL